MKEIFHLAELTATLQESDMSFRNFGEERECRYNWLGTPGYPRFFFRRKCSHTRDPKGNTNKNGEDSPENSSSSKGWPGQTRVLAPSSFSFIPSNQGTGRLNC